VRTSRGNETHEGLGSVDLSLSSVLDGVSRSELLLERSELVLESGLGLLWEERIEKARSASEKEIEDAER